MKKREKREKGKTVRMKLKQAIKIAITKQRAKMNIHCKFCNSGNIIKRGFRKRKNDKVQLYYCRDCNRMFILKEHQKIKNRGDIFIPLFYF